MKILQDAETGQLKYHLDAGEVYSTDEHLSALSEFVSSQSVTVFRLANSYRKVIGRLENLERQLEELKAKT
ncbi:hypothetical protein [Microcoleus sp. B7-D4]|uniref:hypothetical protein n=1 Tax=Microcoleus sp. B7-D4 TaxID=2818696 RepID=UPI002FD4E778